MVEGFAAEPRPGDRLGRYELVECIGRGGAGAVWRARDLRLDRAVALKLLDGVDPRQLARFEREAALAARLSHPGIVQVYEITGLDGPGGRRAAIAMRLIEGPSLEAAWPHLSPARRRELVAAVVDVVAHAHARGVIHRDIKPANVLLEDDERVVLTDFGLARDELAPGELTATGHAHGTVHYMAPEQVRGERDRMGPATDVWALGVMLYRALADRLPFDGPTPAATYYQILSGEPPALRAGTHAATCLRALAKDPAQRPADAGELSRELAGAAPASSSLVRLARTASRRPRAVLAGAIALAALALWATWAHREQTRRLRESRARAELAGWTAPAPVTPVWPHWSRLHGLVREVEAVSAAFHRPGSLTAELDRLDATTAELERYAAEPDAPAACWLQLGIARHLRGRLEPAREALERALALEPSSADARCQLGRTLLELAMLALVEGEALGDGPARGRALLDQASALGAGHAAADPLQRELLQLFATLATGDPDEARARGLAAWSEHCGMLGAEVLALVLAHLATDPVEAIRWLDQAVERRPHDVHILLLRGCFAGRLGQTDEALACYEASLRLVPTLVAELNRALLLDGLGRDAEALAGFDRAIALCGDRSAMVRSNRSVVWLRRGMLDEAEGDLARALELDPQLPSALINRANLRLFRGAPLASLDDATRASELAPRRPEARVAAANALRALGRLEQALTQARSACELAPDEPRWRGLCAELLIALGRPAEAAAEAEVLAHEHPRAAWWFVLGHARLEAGQHAQAIEAFDRVLAEEPRHWHARFKRAYSLEEVGELARARAEYDHMIAEEPREASALANRASLRRRTGDRAGAVEDLERAAASRPGFWQVWLELTQEYVDAGQPERARTAARRALETVPDAQRSVVLGHLQRLGLEGA